MYSEKEINDFLKETKNLLKAEINNINDAQNAVNDLRDVIHFHDFRYYVEADPIISDFDYDYLYKTLRKLEEEYPELSDPDSPTQRVGKGLTKEFPQAAHLVPMLSLDNSYNEEDLVDFDKRVKNLAGQTEIKYCVEPKLDGSSISIVYEDNKLLRGVTRGDGVMGEDITPNVKVLRSVPLKADFSKFGIKTIEIRGEVVIQKEKFKVFNQQRIESGQTALANPRNAAAGSMRLQDAAEVAKRNLEAVLYHISYAVDNEGNDLLGEKLKTRGENLKMLKQLGFKTPATEHKVVNNIQEVLAYCEEWQQKRDEYKYEIDGMVIKVDDIGLEEKLGATTHHPRWAMAFKFGARQAHTTLRDVVFQVGRVGTITPVAKLDKVQVGGVEVSSISMFNEDFIKEKDLRIGDEVVIERAGDVIPYIVMAVTSARNGDEKPIDFPTHCPSCNSELVKTEEEAAWRCVNINCPAQVLERLIHFASRDAMEISGLGSERIEKFVENGWLKKISDIYNLPFVEIEKLKGYGQKSVTKLKKSIEISKQRTLSRLIFGLGIRHVGASTAKLLADNVDCVEELKDWTEERLNGLYDVGPKVALSIFNFFQQEENIELIKKLEAAGVQVCKDKHENKASENGKLSEITFLFTGSLEKFSRTEVKRMAEEAGANVANALSSKVDYLVVGADPGSKVDKAKKLRTVKIINEDEFLKMIND